MGTAFEGAVMRTYVSTLGFHETRVTRPVLRRGLDDDDVVVVLRPASEAAEDRASDALAHLREMLSEVAPGVTIAVERVETGDFERAVLACSDVLRAADGELLINFGGGAREVFLPLTIAAVMHAPRVDTALQYTDVDQQVREWSVPNLTARVPPRAWPTLELLANMDGQASIPELTSRSDRSKSTLTRHVDSLEEHHLVETWKEGKTRMVTLRTSGRLLVRAQRE